MLFAVAAFGSLLLAGCPRSPATALTMADLVGRYNENAAGVPRLWAKAHVAITFPNGLTVGSDSPAVSPNATLMLGKGPNPLGPHDFVLFGRESGEDIFRLGCNTGQNAYYLWYHYGEKGQAWRGRLNLAGAPGVKDIPIDPTQILAVLGVCELPGPTDRLPAAGMTFRDDPPNSAYVLTYVDRQPVSGKVLFRREVLFRWSDTEPARPFRVNLLDEYGRVVMTADLDKYRRISPEEGGPETGPEMPTDIRITWSAWEGPDKDGRISMRPIPHTTSSIHIVLSRMTTQAQGKGDPAVASRYENPGVPETQVDAHLSTEGAPQ